MAGPDPFVQGLLKLMRNNREFGLLGRSYPRVAAELAQRGEHQASQNLLKFMENAEVPYPQIHGTTYDFDTFDPSIGHGIHVGNRDQAMDRVQSTTAGFQPTKDWERHGPNMMPLWLRGKYMLVEDLGGWDPEDWTFFFNKHPYKIGKQDRDFLKQMQNATPAEYREALRSVLEKNGYAGVKYANVAEGSRARDAREAQEIIGEGWSAGDGDMSYMVLDPRNVKSATGNSGAFDRNNPNILAGGLIMPATKFAQQTPTQPAAMSYEDAKLLLTNWGKGQKADATAVRNTAQPTRLDVDPGTGIPAEQRTVTPGKLIRGLGGVLKDMVSPQAAIDAGRDTRQLFGEAYRQGIIGARLGNVEAMKQAGLKGLLGAASLF